MTVSYQRNVLCVVGECWNFIAMKRLHCVIRLNAHSGDKVNLNSKHDFASLFAHELWNCAEFEFR